MTHKLLPCLLCGTSETTVEGRYLSPVMGRPPTLINAILVHRCLRPTGIITAAITFTGRTEEDVVAYWNTRMRPGPPEEHPMRQHSKGQVTLALAATLQGAGLTGDVAMRAALDIMAEGAVPPQWRTTLGASVADAIDADLRDPATWQSGD